MRILSIFAAALFLLSCQNPQKEESSMAKNPTVLIRTNQGEIQVELFEDKAPKTVKNFLRYVDEKHYNNTIFHRVIDEFMVQGGGMDAEMKEKKTHEPIHNEADNRISNKTGTVAMARTSEIHSATAQFYINVADNSFLDYRSPVQYGYCVFGKVTSGMDVVNKIKATKTADKKGHQNVPLESIIIQEIIRK
jgi:cyclophilin family peptidyl-prolyl cis-trans isomerase